MALIAPAAGTITTDKGDIVKTINKQVLINDTRTGETAGSNMREFQINMWFQSVGKNLTFITSR